MHFVGGFIYERAQWLLEILPSFGVSHFIRGYPRIHAVPTAQYVPDDAEFDSARIDASEQLVTLSDAIWQINVLTWQPHRGVGDSSACLSTPPKSDTLPSDDPDVNVSRSIDPVGPSIRGGSYTPHHVTDQGAPRHCLFTPATEHMFYQGRIQDFLKGGGPL